MKDLFRGLGRLIKLIVKTVRETVFTIPSRLLKRIGGAEVTYTAENFWTELFKLWVLMVFASILGLQAISTLLAYLALIIIGEIIYVTATVSDDTLVPKETL